MKFKIAATITPLFFVLPLLCTAEPLKPESVQFPIQFEPNLGQEDAGVKYFARGSDFKVLLSDSGANFLFQNSEGNSSELTLILEGAQGHAKLSGVGAAGASANYFVGNDPSKWRTNVPTYLAAIYKDAYPGIDWKFYEKDGLLEYDFILAPGTEPSQIRLHVKGADEIAIDESGDLIVSTAAGPFRMLAPHAYQDGHPKIEARYKLASDNRIEFTLGSYDPEKPLVIDPKISFGTLLGGATYDSAADVGVDNKGNFYVVGYTEANTRFPGYGDGYVYKFSPTGALLWSAFLIGSGGDSADAIAVAPNGTCYIAGATNSQDFPIVGGFQTRNAGGNDAFIVKLAPNGSGIIRSSYLGGSGNETVTGIELGTGPKLRNGVYVIGNTNSQNFPLKNATQNRFGGGRQDGYLAIIHAINFQRSMSTYIGVDSSDEITSLGLNTFRGDLYAAVTSDGVQGAYVAQLSPSGSGGTVPISVYGVRLLYESTLNPFIKTNFSPAAAYGWMELLASNWTPLRSNRSVGQPSIVIATGSCVPEPPATTCNDSGGLLFFDQDLNRIDSVNFGGPGPGVFVVNDIEGGRNGTIYMVGDTLVKNSPLVNAFQTKYKGGWEGFVIALAPPTFQTTLYSYLGGAGYDFARAVAIDSTDNIIIVGGTSSRKFPTTPGAPKRTLGGTTDGFVVKVTP